MKRKKGDHPGWLWQHANDFRHDIIVDVCAGGVDDGHPEWHVVKRHNTGHGDFWRCDLCDFPEPTKGKADVAD